VGITVRSQQAVITLENQVSHSFSIREMKNGYIILGLGETTEESERG
jgi:hypothetical protein